MTCNFTSISLAEPVNFDSVKKAIVVHVDGWKQREKWFLSQCSYSILGLATLNVSWPLSPTQFYIER